jgi:membrane protease YdiL (CAAX protease family)
MSAFKDKWFYFALGLGLLVCVLLSLVLYSKIKFHPPLQVSFLLAQIFKVAIPEELVFRGILLPFLKNYLSYSWKGWSLANMVTAFLFALAHLFSQPPFWALSTFFPGLIFGYFKEKHNSLLPSVSLHFFYNLCFYSFVI